MIESRKYVRLGAIHVRQVPLTRDAASKNLLGDVGRGKVYRKNEIKSAGSINARVDS